jgi:hypothetical protein
MGEWNSDPITRTACTTFGWSVDSEQRRIVATPEGEFTAEDIRNYLTAISSAKILHYQQLLDLSNATPLFSNDEVNELGVLIRLEHRQRSQPTVGPLAVVLPAQQTEPTARLLGFLSMAPKLMRLFHRRGPAIRWLVRLTRDAAPADQ